MEEPEDLLFQKFQFDRALDKRRSETSKISYPMSPVLGRALFNKKLKFNTLEKLKKILEENGD